MQANTHPIHLFKFDFHDFINFLFNFMMLSQLSSDAIKAQTSIKQAPEQILKQNKTSVNIFSIIV